MEFNYHFRLVYIAAAISITILIIFGVIYIQKSRNQVQYIDEVEHTYKVLSVIGECEKYLVEAETNQRGYLLTHKDQFKTDLESAVSNIDSSLNELGFLTADNPGQKIYFTELKKYIQARLMVMKDNLSLKADDPDYYGNLLKEIFLMDHCKMYMAKMQGLEEGLLKIRQREKNKYQQVNLTFFKATFITACIICVISVGIFFRELGMRLAIQQKLRGKISELSRSKEELEQITFAASHDLQEPMRKVRILSTMIVKKLSTKLPVEEMQVINRINDVTEQMHGLLNDLVLYTNLVNPNENYVHVNLHDLMRSAYHKAFKREDIAIRIAGKLPVIKGSPLQLETLFIHLFDNASKFRSSHRDLVIDINYELKSVKDSKWYWDDQLIDHYHEITISDNGIGFDLQYNEKIFGLFQRLHSQTAFAGKGIGLSVVRRVMTNHKGYVVALGNKNNGASFILVFPAV